MDEKNKKQIELKKENELTKDDKIDIEYLLKPIDTDILIHPSITSFKSIKNYKRKKLHIFNGK